MAYMMLLATSRMRNGRLCSSGVAAVRTRSGMTKKLIAMAAIRDTKKRAKPAAASRAGAG